MPSGGDVAVELGAESRCAERGDMSGLLAPVATLCASLGGGLGLLSWLVGWSGRSLVLCLVLGLPAALNGPWLLRCW